MYCKGLFKRAIPFLLTFTLGILIASIFVPITGSGFQFRKNRWQKHREHHERMEFEIQHLREENERLRQQLSETKEQNLIEGLDVPPPPLMPKVKTVVRETRRTDILQ